MTEITSIIAITCFELMLIGKFASNMCRIFFDEQLFLTLTKLEKIHEKLIQMNVVRPIKLKINWFIIIGFILYFLPYNIRMIYWLIYHQYDNTNLKYTL